MDYQQGYFSDEDYLLMEGEPSPDTLERCIDFIWNALDLHPGSRVLDAGCGTGQIAVSLAKRGCKVTAIDSSDFMIDRCCQNAAETSHVTCIKQDFLTMEFKDEFDAVISWNHSIGYTTREDDKEAIRRMYEALIPGGRVLIDLHNLAAYLKYFIGRHWEERETAFALRDAEFDHADQKFICRNIIAPKNGGEIRERILTTLEYEPEEIKNVLESVGFRDVSFYGDACTYEIGMMFSKEGYNEESVAMIVTGMK